jgi:hypothetical protein
MYELYPESGFDADGIQQSVAIRAIHPATLVVTTTQPAQRTLRELLAAILALNEVPKPNDSARLGSSETTDVVNAPEATNFRSPLRFRKYIGQSDLRGALKIEEILHAPIHSAEMAFTERPLDVVVEELKTDYKIPIVLDTAALETAGIPSNERVTVSVRGGSLKSAIRQIL